MIWVVSMGEVILPMAHIAIKGLKPSVGRQVTIIAVSQMPPFLIKEIKLKEVFDCYDR